MMLVAMVLVGALAGTGLLLVTRGIVGTTTPLSSLVTELHRPRTTSSRRGVASRSSRRSPAAPHPTDLLT